MKNKKMIQVAIAGLFFGQLALQAEDGKAAAPAKDDPKGECHGVNSCKGKGECGGQGHDCAGNNACKGQGWITKTQSECKKLGGTFKK